MLLILKLKIDTIRLCGGIEYIKKNFFAAYCLLNNSTQSILVQVYW